MDIFTVMAFGIVGAILSITIKNIRPEIGILISLATGICLFLYISKGMDEIFSGFLDIVKNSGIDFKYYEIALKACIIAYITQFACELCRDAGEGAIAVKLELCGKVSVLVLSMPVISGFLDAISLLLDKV